MGSRFHQTDDSWGVRIAVGSFISGIGKPRVPSALCKRTRAFVSMCRGIQHAPHSWPLRGGMETSNFGINSKVQLEASLQLGD